MEINALSISRTTRAECRFLAVSLTLSTAIVISSALTPGIEKVLAVLCAMFLSIILLIMVKTFGATPALFVSALAALPIGASVPIYFLQAPRPEQLALLLIIALIATALATLIVRSLQPHTQPALIAAYISNDERLELTRECQRHGLGNSLTILSPEQLSAAIDHGAAPAIELIVISHKNSQSLEGDLTPLRAHLEGVPTLELSDFMSTLLGRVKPEQMSTWVYLQGALPQTALVRGYRAAKGILEPVAALVLAVVMAPVMLVIAIGIKLTSPGPVFYLQRRTGFLGHDFTLIKFRSMRTDAEADGLRWCAAADTRITPLGKFLRRTRLDELPQLWNILRGEMSFIGPRPERPEIYAQLKRAIPLFPLRTVVLPGITGWAQVCAGYASSIEESRSKLEYDLYYIRNCSFRLDLLIALKTLVVACCSEKHSRSLGSGTAPSSGMAINA